MMTMGWIWIGIAIAGVVLELLTPTALVSIWFAVGALAAGICEMLQLPDIIQIAVCLVVSGLLVVIVRPVAVNYLRGNIMPTNVDRFIDEIAIVTKPIGEQTWGEVKIQGILWSAVSVDHEVIKAGEQVRVVAIEGAKLLVRSL